MSKTLKKNYSRKNYSRKNKKSKKNVKQYSRKNKNKNMRGGYGFDRKTGHAYYDDTEEYSGYGTLGDQTNEIIGLICAKNTHVLSADLSSSKIESINTLTNKLIYDEKLTKLDLSNNKIGDEGAIKLAEALKINNTLTELDISDNIIGIDGAFALAEALNLNKSLLILNLSTNNIQTKGAIRLMKVLNPDGNTTLQELNIKNNRFNKLSLPNKVNKNLAIYA